MLDSKFLYVSAENTKFETNVGLASVASRAACSGRAGHYCMFALRFLRDEGQQRFTCQMKVMRDATGHRFEQKRTNADPSRQARGNCELGRIGKLRTGPKQRNDCHHWDGGLGVGGGGKDDEGMEGEEAPEERERGAKGRTATTR